MKQKNSIILGILTLVLVLFSSCTHPDGTSLWGEGLWVSLLLTGGASLFFGFKTYQDTKVIPGSVEKPSKFYQSGYFYFAVCAIVSFIYIIIDVVNSR